ncbi:putative membrane protein [Nakamurella sp. UYEF19]|uniref:DUF1269 domain-containing protein n=1 Tax=Nakamurella sp. UYEF19 TaxID=1756392 RepID=UPI00339B17C8
MTYNSTVLIFSLKDASRSPRLLAELRRDSDVRQALIVERRMDGQLHVRDVDIPRGAGVPVVTGGAIGALIGVLGGPLGMLLGWSVGALGGLAYSAVDSDEDEDGLHILSAGIAPGGNVVLAEVINDVYPAEQRAKEYDGSVVRVPGDQIAYEVESARVAAELAADAARKARHERKSADFKAGMHRLFHHDKADA